MNEQHRIDVEQNKPERVELLRAQRLMYAKAKLYQNALAVVALLLPAIGVLFGIGSPAIRPYLGFGSILVLLLDVGLVSRIVKTTCKQAAKVQEQFDTEVLGLGWNRLLAGSKVDVEDVRAITASPLPEAEKKSLEGWYEPIIGSLPLPVGRLLCQRTNVVYDTRVRRTYRAILLSSAVLLCAALTLVGLYQGISVNDVILTLYLPALPFVAFVLREYRKQDDAIETLATLKTEIEKLWDKALAGSSPEELTLGSRGIQDAIYRHRAGGPLVFDWLYNRLREGNEGLTRHAVEKLAAQVKQSLEGLKPQ